MAGQLYNQDISVNSSDKFIVSQKRPISVTTDSFSFMRSHQFKTNQLSIGGVKNYRIGINGQKSIKKETVEMSVSSVSGGIFTTGIVLNSQIPNFGLSSITPTIQKNSLPIVINPVIHFSANPPFDYYNNPTDIADLKKQNKDFKKSIKDLKVEIKSPDKLSIIESNYQAQLSNLNSLQTNYSNLVNQKQTIISNASLEDFLANPELRTRLSETNYSINQGMKDIDSARKEMANLSYYKEIVSDSELVKSRLENIPNMTQQGINQTNNFFENLKSNPTLSNNKDLQKEINQFQKQTIKELKNYQKNYEKDLKNLVKLQKKTLSDLEKKSNIQGMLADQSSQAKNQIKELKNQIKENKKLARQAKWENRIDKTFAGADFVLGKMQDFLMLLVTKGKKKEALQLADKRDYSATIESANRQDTSLYNSVQLIKDSSPTATQYSLSNIIFNQKDTYPVSSQLRNPYLASLISAGADAMSNMFNIYITFFNGSADVALEDTFSLFNWKDLKKNENEITIRKKTLEDEFLSFRIKSINIPGSVKGSFEIKVPGGDTVLKPATHYDYERKASLTIRLDQMLYLSNFFNLLSRTSYDLSSFKNINTGGIDLDNVEKSLKKAFQSSIVGGISARIFNNSELNNISQGRHINVLVRRSACKFLYFNEVDVKILKNSGVNNERTATDSHSGEDPNTKIRDSSFDYSEKRIMKSKDIKTALIETDVWDSGNFKYEDSEIGYPWTGQRIDKMNDMFVFSDVKFLGATDGIQFNRESANPVEMTYDFIYKNCYRMTSGF